MECPYPTPRFPQAFYHDLALYGAANSERQLTFLARCTPDQKAYAQRFFDYHRDRRYYVDPTLFEEFEEH